MKKHLAVSVAIILAFCPGYMAMAIHLGSDACRFIDVNTSEPVLLIGAANIDLGFSYKGEPDIFVTGFDSNPSDPLPINGSFDLEGALDSMSSYGTNLLCLYVSEHVWGPPMGNEGDGDFEFDLPWEQCCTGGGYQLKNFNPVFWEKLDQVLTAAADRDIITQIIVFNKSSFWVLDANPWNPVLNINDGSPACDGIYYHGTEGISGKDDFFYMRTETPLNELDFVGDSRDLNMLQRIFLDHAVDQHVGSYQNVLIELVNEFETVTDEGYEWLETFHNYLGSRTSVPVVYNPFGFNQANLAFANLQSIDVIGLHLNHDQRRIHREIIRARRLTGKPVMLNEPLKWRNTDNARRTAWTCLMAGGTYLGWKDILTVDNWFKVHAYLEQIAELVESGTVKNRFPELYGLLDYWAFDPVLPEEDCILSFPEELNNAFAMANNKKEETLIYLDGSCPETAFLTLDLEPGMYRLFWLDPSKLIDADPVRSAFRYQWQDPYLLPADQDGNALFFFPEKIDNDTVIYLSRTGNAGTGIDIQLNANQSVYKASDLCNVSVTFINDAAPNPAPELDCVLALELDGQIYYAPTWSQDSQTFPITLSQNQVTENIFHFIWPDISEPIGPIRLYAGLLAPGSDRVVSSVSMVEFTYEP